MSITVTADDFDAVVYDVEAATSRTKSSVKKQTGIFGIAHSLWNCDRKLKTLLQVYRGLEAHAASVPGLQCQAIEDKIADVTQSLDEALSLCRSRGIHNRALTGVPFRSLERGLESLKDIWVALNASTDSEVDELLRSTKRVEYADWEPSNR